MVITPSAYPSARRDAVADAAMRLAPQAPQGATAPAASLESSVASPVDSAAIDDGASASPNNSASPPSVPESGLGWVSMLLGDSGRPLHPHKARASETATPRTAVG